MVGSVGSGVGSSFNVVVGLDQAEQQPHLRIIYFLESLGLIPLAWILK